MARNLREADDDGGEEEFDYGEEPNFEVLKLVANNRVFLSDPGVRIDLPADT